MFSLQQDTMKVSTLCVRLIVTVLLQNSFCVQEADAAFLHVDPNRLQFFEYESVSLHCGGSSEWRVMKKVSSNTPQWNTSAGSLNISPAFVSHSGEYFCENGEGERGNAVNISVTAGDVILESPALPVRERQTLTLRCRKRKTAHNSPADFFKDGRFIRTEYTGSMIIPNVSSSSEGLYRCSVPGAGSSSESQLAVTAYIAPGPTEDHESSVRPSDSGPIQLSVLLPAVLTVSVSVLLLLLSLLGLLYCRKHRVACFSFKVPTGSNPLPVCEQAIVAEQPMDVYANITGRRKKRVCREANVTDQKKSVTSKRKKRVCEHASVSQPHMDVYANITTYKKRRGGNVAGRQETSANVTSKKRARGCGEANPAQTQEVKPRTERGC